MKKKQIPMGLIGAILFSFSLTHADGTRGGGEIVRTSAGEIRLRDLVDNVACQYTTGVQQRSQSPFLNAYLRKIARLDWYFAAGLKYEIDQLEICLTANLRKLHYTDHVPVNLRKTKTEQLAVRVLDSHQVYMDREMLADLHRNHPRDEAFTYVHEALHSFVYRYTESRQLDVMSAVVTLQKVVDGLIRSPSQMQDELSLSSIQFPWVSRELSKARLAIEWGLSSPEEQRQGMLKYNLDSLLNFDAEDLGVYLYQDHQYLFKASPAQRIFDLLVVTGPDLKLFSRLVNEQADIQALDPLLVAISAARELSNGENTGPIDSIILNSQAMRNGPQIYRKMINKDLVVGPRQRIFGVSGYIYLGEYEGSVDEVPALAVIPLTTATDLPPEVSGLLDLVVKSIQREGVDGSLVEQLLTKNEYFYRAFEVQSLVEKLTTLQVPIARERTHLMKALPGYIKGLRRVLYQKVRDEVNEQMALDLDAKIQWSKLGLKETGI